MASSIIFGIFIFLLETYITSGTCEDYFVEVDTHNVSLTFYFGWNSTETKRVQCSHGYNTIGKCYYIFEFECPLEPTSPGVYNMSTNTDLTVVNVTILTFNSTTSGNYSCSKDSGTTTISKCVKPSVITTTQPTTNTTSQTEDLTEGCTIGSIVVGVIGLVSFIIDIGLILRLHVIKELTKVLLGILEKTGIVIMALTAPALGAGLSGAALCFSKVQTPCDEGWSASNVAVIVLGIIGNILLIILASVFIHKLTSMRKPCCGKDPVYPPEPIIDPVLPLQPIIDTVPPPEPIIAHLVKDLYHGLVFSHISGFLGNSAEDLKNHFRRKIDLCLFVIPKSCMLVLPSQSNNTLQFVEETSFHGGGNEGVYTVTIYKTRSAGQKYYICAQVPTVLNVYSQLPQELTRTIYVDSELHRFQLLYQEVLNVKRWNDTVQLVTCKGEDDVALALFEAAANVVRKKEPTGARTSGGLLAPTSRGRDKSLTADFPNGSNRVPMAPSAYFDERGGILAPTSRRRDKSLTADFPNGSNGVPMALSAYFDESPTIISNTHVGDVIPGLAWDYVQNYMKKTLTLELRQQYIDNIRPPINCECITKLIIVWVKSCNTIPCLTKLANKRKDTRRVNRLEEDPQNGQPVKLNVFQFKETKYKYERCFIAEYCTPMKCIKMMKEDNDYKKFAAVLEEPGLRFKKMFDEIMSMNTIQEIFGEVSFIYFDDLCQESSLIDMLEHQIRWQHSVVM